MPKDIVETLNSYGLGLFPSWDNEPYVSVIDLFYEDELNSIFEHLLKPNVSFDSAEEYLKNHFIYDVIGHLCVKIVDQDLWVKKFNINESDLTLPRKYMKAVEFSFAVKNSRFLTLAMRCSTTYDLTNLFNNSIEDVRKELVPSFALSHLFDKQGAEFEADDLIEAMIEGLDPIVENFCLDTLKEELFEAALYEFHQDKENLIESLKSYEITR